MKLKPFVPACALIVDGKPVMRGETATDANGLSSGFWDCTAGGFLWTYDVDEIIYIIEGEAHIRDMNSDGWQTLTPGCTMRFPAGSVAAWQVPNRVLKFWVIRARPGMLRRLFNLLTGRI